MEDKKIEESKKKLTAKKGSWNFKGMGKTKETFGRSNLQKNFGGFRPGSKHTQKVPKGYQKVEMYIKVSNAGTKKKHPIRKNVNNWEQRALRF